VDRPTAGGPALRYVALGDSYTIGTSVAVADRWPDRLVAALGAGDGEHPALQLVANLGVNGYTTADLIREELPPLAGLHPDVVSVLIGVNDVVQGVAPDAYARNVVRILDDVLATVPSDRLVTVGIPDYTVTPAGADYGEPTQRRAAIVDANGIMAALAAERRVAFVDILDLSSRAASDRSLVASDGLHPSGAQYALWVERIAPVVGEWLAR
jgi:lysophospholipase L1-like esterase